MGALFEPFFYIIGLVVDLYFKAVVIEIVLHWLIHFKVLEVSNKYSKKFMEVLEGITHPIYKKISEKIPPVGGFDLSVQKKPFHPFCLTSDNLNIRLGKTNPFGNKLYQLLVGFSLFRNGINAYLKHLRTVSSRHNPIDRTRRRVRTDPNSYNDSLLMLFDNPAHCPTLNYRSISPIR